MFPILLSAINLKQVVVKFNKNVEDVEEVADKNNYNLDKGSIESVAVNGYSATLTLADGVENQIYAKLTVNNKILESEKSFTFKFFDATLPEVVNVKVTGPKTLEIEFTEPIETQGTITLKSGSSTLSVNNSNISGFGTNKITVPLYSTLTDGKQYTITIKQFADYAGYVNVIGTVTFVYEKDEAAPVAFVTDAEQEYVVVEFNKPVKGITKDHFSHTFTAWKAIKVTDTDSITDPEISASDSVTKVYVWFYGDGSADERPIPEGTTTFRILGKDSAGNEIKDEWGNRFETIVYSIAVTADKTAPEVDKIDVIDEDKLKVVFTKDVSFGESNIEVFDEVGKEIDGVTISISGGPKEYTVNLGKDLSGKTVIVNIANVEDTTLNANKLSSYSTVLEITDKTGPSVNKVTYDSTEKVLYVFFNEKLDENTALVAGNYYLVNGTTFLKLSKTPVFFIDNSIVKIGLTDTEASSITTDSTTLFIAGVTDLAGNEIGTNLTSAVKAKNEYKPVMEKVEATATNTVEITFSQKLAEVDMSAFTVTSETQTHTIVGMDVTEVNSKTKVILTIKEEEKLAYDVTGVSIAYADATKIENLFGVNPDTNESKTIADKIKPQLIGNNPIVASGKSIEIKFTEDLDSTYAALYAQDLVIVDGNGTTLLAGVDYGTTLKAGDNKIIVVTKADGSDLTPGTYKVKSKADITYIRDGAENLTEAFTNAVEVTIAEQ